MDKKAVHRYRFSKLYDTITRHITYHRSVNTDMTKVDVKINSVCLLQLIDDRYSVHEEVHWSV